MPMDQLRGLEREFEEHERKLWQQLMARLEPEDEPVYRLADQPTKAIVQEEIRLLGRLHRGIEKRIDPELMGEKRQERIHDLLNEDEELSAVAARLERLSRSHDESVMLGLARVAEEEEREEAEEEGWSP